MSRRPARFSETEWRLIVSAVKDAGVAVEVFADDTVRISPANVLHFDKGARHANGNAEARIAAAPWAKSR